MKKNVCCVCGRKLDFFSTYNKDFNKVCSSCNKIIKYELNFGAIRGIGDVSTKECREVYFCYLQKNEDNSIENINNINNRIDRISERKNISFGTILIGIILLILGVTITYNAIVDKDLKVSSNQFSYAITHSGVRESDGLYYISGIVTNNSNYDVDYLKIEFICYDKVGNNIGTIFDATQNLLSKEKWNFESIYIGTRDVEICKFYKITPGTVLLEIS